MDLEMVGKRTFISGSTQGIGYAIAEALLREGATVVVNGRDEQNVLTAVERLKMDVPDADVTGIAADFADPEQVRRLMAQLGEVDILVNNVGVFDVVDFIEIPDEEW